MKKKTRYKFKPLDFLVIFVCLSICAGSIFLFWKDLNKTTTRTDKDSIATISFKYKIAQRKFDDRVVWERIQQNSSLYNLDTIRTADLAEAYITFKDGTVINIYENTMLQVSYDEKGGVALSVNGGNITVDSTNSENKVSLQMDNGTVLNLDAGSKLNASFMGESKEGAFLLQAGSGSIVQSEANESGRGLAGLFGGAGGRGTGAMENSSSQTSAGSNENTGTFTPITLIAGESAHLSSNGEVRRGAITVTSIASDLRVLNFEENRTVPVHLEWNATEALAESLVIIQTSRTSDFSTIENTYTEIGSSAIDVEAAEGTLYWRVFAEDGEDQPVEGRVRVVPVDAVTISGPRNDAVYSYRTEFPVIQFGWQGNSYADHYKIEIASAMDFAPENILIDQDVSTERVSFAELDEGRYFWRITPYYLVNNIGYTEPSEVLSFKVVHREAPQAPRLFAPANNARIVHHNDDFDASFKWRSEVAAADYELLIAKDEAFTNVVYSSSTNALQLQQNFNSIYGADNSLSDGQYFWKILRRSEEDAGACSSEVRSFTVARYVPALNRLIYPPDNYSVEASRVNSTVFSWRLADEYKAVNAKTIVQICKNADFTSDVIETDVSNTTELRNVNLSDGTYFWRIGVMDAVKAEFVYTEERILNILKELGSPVITYPQENQMILCDNSAVVNVQWQNVEGADYYKVCAIDSASGILMQEIGEVRGTNQQVRLTPAAGSNLSNYKFTVQAFAQGTEYSAVRSGRASSVDFNLRGVRKIHMNYPENAARFEGLTALRNPIEIRWNPDSDIPANSQFILRKVQWDGSVRIIQTLSNPEERIELDRLTEGTYQWVIRASTEDGISLSDDVFRSFTVTPVLDLPRAVLTGPENGLLMNASYLKRNRNIVFSWQPVPGATDYSFILYQRQSDGTLRRVTSASTGNQTSYRIRDLSILDIGEFEWQVTAYCHAADGYVEQSSPEAVGRFTIDFRRPGRVRTKDPGRLYGE